MTRQTYSLDEIKHMLIDHIDAVARHYAPEANGAHVTQGRYFTLNPGRADRSVGSFYITLRGHRAGYWKDHATGQHGDILDLIALSLAREGDTRAALAEARAYLGLATDDPQTAARRKAAAAAAKERAALARARDREARERRGAQARAIWLSGQARLRGTPVEYYLRGRGIDLARLGRQPGVLRYVPECRYYDEDPETGEITEARLPAMAAIVTDARGRQTAVHRTWLALGPDGQWHKAPVRQPKKVLGQYAGAAINIWRGVGPRGGKPASLPQCPANTHVYVTEGIEDALSLVLLDPAARVLAAISLGNLAALVLPENVSTITLVADCDENEEAQAALQRAIAAHQDAGRIVRLWQNKWGGKDLNDALRLALGAQDAARPKQEREGRHAAG